jgi:hypothetical protein
MYNRQHGSYAGYDNEVQFAYCHVGTYRYSPFRRKGAKEGKGGQSESSPHKYY